MKRKKVAKWTILMMTVVLASGFAACDKKADSKEPESVEENVISEEADTKEAESADNSKDPATPETETESDEVKEVNEESAPVKTFESETTFTEEIFEYFATCDWQYAYKDVLNGMVNEDGTYKNDYDTIVEYALYDIDKNDVPELFVKHGSCEADFQIDIYSNKGKEAVCVDTIGGGHSELYTYPVGNGFIIHMAHMGYGYMELTKLENGALHSKTLFEDDMNERLQLDPDADYVYADEIVPGAQAIQLKNIYYIYGLISYETPIKMNDGERLADVEFASMVSDTLNCKQYFYMVDADRYTYQSNYTNPQGHMLGLYEREGLFEGSEASAELEDVIYDDYDGDGDDEALAVFNDPQYKNKALILFDYQNNTMYGYLCRFWGGREVEVDDGHIYTASSYRYGRGYELTFEYCLDQAVVNVESCERVILSDTAKESLVRFRQDLKTDGGKLGVAFLGWAGLYSDVMLDTIIHDAMDIYSDEEFMAELDRFKCIKQPGEEVYLLVPANEDYAITVYEQIWGEDTADGMPERGKLLYKAKPGEPVLVRGNQSDIVSNIEVSMDCNGEEMIYHPSLSLENGLLSQEEEVVDFSRY